MTVATTTRLSGASEREEIGKLRKAELEVIRGRHGLAADPDILVGLALSGGGIRSAAFNLGVLQAFGKRGVLDRTHYLSTVSGGGYIGSCYSAMVAGDPGSEFPFGFDGRDEPAILRHLRRHSNYLAPRRGLFSLDTWRLVSAYIGGLLVTAATVLGWLALIAALALWAHGALVSRFIPGAGLTAWSDPWAHLGRLFAPAGAALGLWALGGLLHVPHVVGVAEYSFRFRQGLARTQALLFAVACALALLGTAPLLFHYLDVQRLQLRAAGGAAILVALLAPLLKVAGRLQVNAGLLKRIGLTAGLTVLATLIGLLVLYATWLLRDNLPVVIGVAAGGLLVLAQAADINRISLFYTYRDKLSEAFVVRDSQAGIVSQEQLTLSALASDALPMPFHLINTTVNVAGSDDLELHGRKGDFFLLSPLHCGSLVTGYRKTVEYENDGVSLASALAVSGAAASPQMGYATRPALAFLMTLFNVRLGVWAENPKYPPPRGLFSRFSRARTRWPLYLLAELFSQANESRALVYLSDGGHMENLGVFELLRRECDVVICSDASADPERSFADLGRLIRLARVDLGAQIEVDVEPLRPDDKGLSAKHYAVGRIEYKGTQPPRFGLFVYIKSAVTAKDPADLHAYQRRHPDFPHQPTSDQFFDEAQFESYRELGYCSARASHDWMHEVRAGVLQPPTGVPPSAVTGFFAKLHGKRIGP